MTFSERLMQLRKQRGWSQEELGEMLGVTRQTVSKWELGSTTPEMEKLAAMSEIFGISIDELVKGKSAEEVKAGYEPERAAIASEKPSPRHFHYEYKSARTWHGLPLVHVNVGFGKYRAKGVLAIGNVAMGIFSLGIASFGVVSVGVAALGLLAMGYFAIGIFAGAGAAVGLFAAGGAAVGLFAAGGASVGWFAVGGAAVGQYAIGGYAVGAQIALGGTASGTIAIGDTLSGDILISSPISAEEFRAVVAEKLPGTPQFLTDFFANAAEGLHIDTY